MDASGKTNYTYTLGNQLRTEISPFANSTVTNTYVNRLRTSMVLQQPTGLWTNSFGFTCIDLKTGERKWKGGRYGKGQILLLENSGVLLVLSEWGQVVLVAADPNEHREIASFQALEGKTWNHPVLAGGRLYVRNSEQAAAYKLDVSR